MKNKIKALTSIFASGAFVAAGAYLYQCQECTDGTSVQAELVQPAVKKIRTQQDVVGTKTITATKDDRKIRDFQFKKTGSVIKAEGIEITAPGNMKVTSQVTGGVLEQTLTNASLRVDGKTARTLKREAATTASTSHDGTKGRVRYDDFYEGVDLEYAYDGKDVEEFYHLSDALKKEIIASGADLHLSALFPKLSTEQGAIFSEVGTPTHSDGAWGMPDGEGGVIRPESDRISDKDIELAVRQHLFTLPKAIAFDETGKKQTLQRELKWRDDGLRVSVVLPNAWVKESQGRIVIDPSVIDNSRAVDLSSWQEENIVRDSTGRMHVVYRGVYNGSWTAMYTSGTGSVWDEPTPIKTNLYAGATQYYTPTLVIDGLDRLHVVFADYGNITESTEKTAAGFTYPGYGNIGYYARCDNQCASKEWRDPFTQEAGGGLLPATANRYQQYFDMSVNSSNEVFLTYREDGANRATVAYKIGASGFTALPGLGDAYLSQNIVVDSNDKVHFVAGEYYGEYSMRVYQLNANQTAWMLRDKRVPRIRTGMSVDSSAAFVGGNDGYLRHYRLSTTVDKDNYFHILAEVKDEWHKDKWRMMYYEFNPNTNNDQTYNTTFASVNATEGQLRELWLSPVENPNDHTYHPSITVDDTSTPVVHAFWWRNADPSPYVEYASMTRGANAFNTPTRFLTTLETQGAPKVRSRVPHPATTNDSAYCTSVSATAPCAHPNGQVRVDGSVALIDLVVVLGSSDLRYISTGQPVESPTPKTPLDHSYTQSTTPTLTFDKIPSDNGSNGVTYEVQVDTTPLFNSVSNGPLITLSNLAVDNTGALSTTLSDGNFYYWRVRASKGNASGPWSVIFELGVDNTPPGAFNLLTPADNSDPGTKTPTFTWEAASD